jgi:hypothetical protein
MDFQDGQTQTIGGVTYVRQGGVWHQQASAVYGTPRTPAPQTAPQAQQDVLQVDKLRSDLANVPLQQESTRTNIEQNRQSMQNQRFNQNQGLRQEFNALPEVKNYSAALTSLGTALKAPDTPQGDLAVIYAYAKAADPGSVVREGEMDMATATASLPEKYRADALRLTQGKRLPPEVRTGLVETMRQAVSGMRQTYDQQRTRYGQLAEQSGFDPQQIVGQPLYDAIRPLEEQYIRAHGGVPRDPNAPINVGASAPTEAGFGIGGGARELTPDQQARERDFLSTNPTPEQYAGFLAALQGGGTIDVAAAKQRLDALRGGAAYNPLIGTDPRVTELAEQLKQQGGAGDAANVGAVQGITLNAGDEIASAGAALKGALSGEGSFGDLYGVNEQANQIYNDFLQQTHPVAYGAGTLGGGAVLAPLTFGAETPAQLAGLGAGIGAVAGFNGGEGGIGNRALGAVEGAGAGAALGYAIPKGAAALRKKPEQVPPLVDPQTGALNQPLEAMSPGQRVVKAEEYGINLPADAAGGRTAAVLGKGLDIMPGSAGVMEDARRATESQIGAASDVVASRFGKSRTMNEAGAELQRGANERIDRAKTVIGKAYDAIPISDSAQTSTANTVGTLQQLTGRFQSNPDLAEALKDPKLATYLGAVQKGLSWKDMKDFRSIIGEKIGEMRLGESSSTSDLRALYGALSQDMRDSAAAQGPGALRAFERANGLNRQNEELVQGALARIIGKDGNLAPEKAAAAVQAMTKGGKSTGDLKTLAQIKAATMKSGAWNEIAATLIRLGGQPANSAGRDFNPQTFVHWYADMAEPARRMLFGGSNNELRKALDGFVAVNQRLQNVNALRNTSQTAGNLTAAGTVGTMAAAITNPMLGAKLLGVMAGNYGMAKLWTNPGFVRLMTGYSKAVASGNNQAVKSQIGRISALAATNPELREPLMALQQRLLSAANDNVGRVAASPQNDQTNQQ